MALRPTLSRGLPLSSDGAAGALGVGESKRCAKDRLPVVGRQKWALGSQSAARGGGQDLPTWQKSRGRFTLLFAMEPRAPMPLSTQVAGMECH